MTIEPGTRVGAYEVQDAIGQGAMGLVYRAWHPALQRAAAVKVLQALAPDPDAAARFRREAQSIAQMRHPNVLNVYDFGEAGGVPYMVVEFVPDGSLADRLKRAPMSRAEAVGILRGIASALDYAHALGVVHRDVKPANVLMHSDGTPVLADFGLAKLLQSASVKSMTGATTGTPVYMAPEQVQGGEIGPAADVYALATVAFELLTGGTPFGGGSVLEVLYAQVHREPPAPSSRNAEVPPAVDAVILRGLAKDPTQRWPSCGEMVGELDRALSTPAPAAVPAPPVETTVAMPPPAAPRPSAPKNARRRTAIALGVIAAVLLGILGVLALARQGAPSVGVSDASPHAGMSVDFTAHRLPPNQAGEVVLDSAGDRIGSFQADAAGDASGRVQVPYITPVGRHTLKLCWDGQCRAVTDLHVQSRLN